MVENVPIEVFSGVTALVAILGGIVWNDLNAKIKELQDEQNQCPFPNMQRDISIMKTDIGWLKEYLTKKL